MIDGRLHPADVAAIAQQVAALLRAEPQAPRLLTAEQVADRFGVGAAWVREHAVELGALRLGDGPRPRLRFNADTVADALTACCGSRRSTTPETPATTPETADHSARRAGAATGSWPVRQLSLDPSQRNRPRAATTAEGMTHGEGPP